MKEFFVEVSFNRQEDCNDFLRAFLEETDLDKIQLMKLENMKLILIILVEQELPKKLKDAIGKGDINKSYLKKYKDKTLIPDTTIFDKSDKSNDAETQQENVDVVAETTEVQQEDVDVAAKTPETQQENVEVVTETTETQQENVEVATETTEVQQEDVDVAAETPKTQQDNTDGKDENTEQQHDILDKVNTSKKDSCGSEKEEIISIKDLREIARKITTFDEFVDLLMGKLKVEEYKYRDILTKLLRTVAETEIVRWKEFENKGCCLKQTAKIAIGKIIKNNFEMETIAFLKEVRKIHEEFFLNPITGTESSMLSDLKEPVHSGEGQKSSMISELENSKGLRPIPNSKNSIPRIPEFEQAVDEILAKEKKLDRCVVMILEYMGSKNLDITSRKYIEYLTRVSVKEGKLVRKVTNIPPDKRKQTQMTLADLINVFIRKYNPQAGLVRVEDFILYLSEFLKKIQTMKSEETQVTTIN